MSGRRHYRHDKQYRGFQLPSESLRPDDTIADEDCTQEQLFYRYAGFIIGVMRHHRIPRTDDRCQVAAMALWYACACWKPEKGEFQVYAYVAIRNHVRQADHKALRYASRMKQMDYVGLDDEDRPVDDVLSNLTNPAFVIVRRDERRRTRRAINQAAQEINDTPIRWQSIHPMFFAYFKSGLPCRVFAEMEGRTKQAINLRFEKMRGLMRERLGELLDISA